MGEAVGRHPGPAGFGAGFKHLGGGTVVLREITAESRVEDLRCSTIVRHPVPANAVSGFKHLGGDTVGGHPVPAGGCLSKKNLGDQTVFGNPGAAAAVRRFKDRSGINTVGGHPHPAGGGVLLKDGIKPFAVSSVPGAAAAQALVEYRGRKQAFPRRTGTAHAGVFFKQFPGLAVRSQPCPATVGTLQKDLPGPAVGGHPRPACAAVFDKDLTFTAIGSFPHPAGAVFLPDFKKETALIVPGRGALIRPGYATGTRQQQQQTNQESR